MTGPSQLEFTTRNVTDSCGSSIGQQRFSLEELLAREVAPHFLTRFGDGRFGDADALASPQPAEAFEFGRHATHEIDYLLLIFLGQCHHLILSRLVTPTHGTRNPAGTEYPNSG